MKTKLFSLLCTLMCAGNVFAYDAIIDGIYYNLNSTDLTAEVTNETGDFQAKSYSGSVSIPETVTYSNTTYQVTTIGDGAFFDCTGLNSVTIPNSVITIGDYAFDNCYNLTSITIPNSVTTIGNYAFSHCSGLTSVTIGNSVTTIGDYAFNYCRGLASVTIPHSVTMIGGWAFSVCNGLTSITIPNSVTTIGDYVFYACQNLTLLIVESGNSIYDSRDNCNAIIKTATNTLITGCKNTIIPNSVTTIGDNAFYSCSDLTSITIPNSVTKIGWEAFAHCYDLTSITIPNSVTAIGNSAFGYCSSIENVYVYVPNPYPFETKDPEVIVNPIITEAFTATTPQYILQNVAQISTDNTPTCALVRVDLSKMETSQYAKMALDFAGTKYELSTKESTVILTGLNPASTNQATFYSQLVGESQWREGATIELSTGDLALTTLTPKVVSAGNVVVAASTNISDLETNVGFEWRKYNAPPELPSSRAQAILYNGQMEGILHNLSLEYWRVRAYYEAADGTCYYGEWATFDPSQPAFFEPTVHTYAMATSPTSNKTQVRGYVMTGTDEVTEQGFEYWFKGAKAPRRVASATPDSIYRVQASGQVMTAVLEDLAYSTTYTCRAYAVAGGKTYYGEEVQFLTPEDPRPIYTLYVMAGENGSVNTDVSGQYREGEIVTLTATPMAGYHFLQWSDGNTDNPRQLTIMADTELVALFELADGLEQLIIDNAQGTVRKFIHNNQLFIFHNGNLFTATGARVK